MRYCIIQNVGRTPIIRIDTNQGIYGLGEVRDGADERYALMLKSRILDKIPATWKCYLKRSNNLAAMPGRAVAYARWKWRYGISAAKPIMFPAWQLLGGRYRDKVRMYADTPEAPTMDEFKVKIKHRLEVRA